MIPAFSRWNQELHKNGDDSFVSKLSSLLKIEEDAIPKQILTNVIDRYVKDVKLHLSRSLRDYLRNLIREQWKLQLKHCKATATFLLRDLEWWGKRQSLTSLEEPYVTFFSSFLLLLLAFWSVSSVPGDHS